MPSIEYWTLKNVRQIHDDMERVIKYCMTSGNSMILTRKRTWRPSTDIYETLDQIVIVMETAGAKEEEIKVDFDDRAHVLAIRGRRDDDNAGSDRSFIQMEINYGSFEVFVIIPWSVDENGIRALYKNGFLRVTIPKSGKTDPTQVEIVDL